VFKFQGYDFDWDEDKKRTNKEKHGVDFEEAVTVFGDENYAVFPDEKHSDNEDRFYIIGISKNLRLLTVCHCYRQNDTVIRIISAWKASQTEKELYGGVK